MESEAPGLCTDELTVATEGGKELPWQSFKFQKKYTNVFLWDSKAGKILLGLKKRGFGKDKYNGFGGKVEPDETSAEAALRELKEEAGIESPLTHAGTLLFYSPNSQGLAHYIEIFSADSYTGAITESEEMRPKWFALPQEYKDGPPSREEDDSSPILEDIPWDKMWEDDKLWFPFLLSRKKFSGRVDFGEGGDFAQMQKWWFGVKLT